MSEALRSFLYWDAIVWGMLACGKFRANEFDDLNLQRELWWRQLAVADLEELVRTGHWLKGRAEARLAMEETVDAST